MPETEEQKNLKESALLLLCPFCGGTAEFIFNKSNQILLQHFPKSGVNCPARCEMFCETFSFGREIWNRHNGARILYYHPQDKDMSKKELNK